MGKIVGFLFIGCSLAGMLAEVRGENLREIIENQIRIHVLESVGELAGQNFSDEDLERFRRNKVLEQITAMLQRDRKFLAAVEKLRAIPVAEREKYLKECRKPLRKTWRELGEISPKGTTEAGQRCELAISNAITDLAEKILARPAAPNQKGGA